MARTTLRARPEKEMLIGDAAKRAGVPIAKLRSDTNLGRVVCRVSEWSGYRYYTPEEIDRYAADIHKKAVARGWSK